MLMGQAWQGLNFYLWNMNTKQANIFARISLTVLGLFLLFWLNSEFHIRKDVLVKEFQLAEEKEALDSKLDSIKNGLAELDSTLVDNDRTSDMEDLERGKKILESLSESLGFNSEVTDSIINKIINNENTDTTFVIVGGGVADSVTFTISLNSEGRFATNEYYEGVNREAFQQIIPQIIFGILLFGLVFLTVFFFRKNIKKQEALNLERTNLISNLTHELKTPVATIAVALEAIEHFGVMDDKEKTTTYIQNAQHELQRLTSGINSMLQISKVSQENPYFKSEKVNLNELCYTAVQSLSVQTKQLDIELDSDIPVKKMLIYGDAQHLQNVIINLLDNAIKYRKPDQPKVVLSLQEKQDNIELRIKDNGIGIDKAYHQRIFERFYRITEENIHNVKGYGMGLSYVKKVLDAHDAPIRVDSKLDEGSTFTIIFKKVS